MISGRQATNQFALVRSYLYTDSQVAIHEISSPRSNHTDGQVAIQDVSSLREIVGRYQACMLELEKMMHPKIHELREERAPIPINVRIIDNKYYVLLLVLHAEHLDKPLRAAREISCNGRTNGTSIGHRLENPTPPQDMVIVECPEAVNPAETTLSNLTIVIPPHEKSEEAQTFAFGEDVLGKMVECEKLDISSFEQMNPKTTDTNADERDVSIGAAIIIRSYLQPWNKGKEWRGGQAKTMREQAIEYAEYHHLLGVDHVWIYMNEAWDDGRDLPHRDYITWIPFDWNVYNHKKFSKFPNDHSYYNLYRVAGQTDAIWRARREGMDWIILNDVDEYVRIGPLANPRCPNGTCGTVGSLSRFMRNYTDLNAPGIAPQYKEDGGIIKGGLRLESVYYGRNKDVDQDDDIRLIIDNVWRKTRPPDFKKSGYLQNHRRKMIVDPNMVTSNHLHDVTSMMKICKKFPLIRINDDVIRVNHYKKPQTGVQMNENNSHERELCFPCTNGAEILNPFCAL
jgi:hypothetical protein